MNRLIKNFISRMLWMARGTATLMGLATMLALTVGLASSALAGTGAGTRFDLGKVNAVSTLVNSLAGPSLKIRQQLRRNRLHGAGPGGASRQGAIEDQFEDEGYQLPATEAETKELYGKSTPLKQKGNQR